LGDLEYILERSYEMRDSSERSMNKSGGICKVSESLVHPMGEM
jgi:hypothetical protein